MRWFLHLILIKKWRDKSTLTAALQVLSILISGFFPNGLIAQKALTSTAYLEEKIQLTTSSSSNNKTAFLNNSWIEEIDLRTQTKDFDWRRQGYTVRLSPYPSKVRKAEKQYFQHIQTIPNSKKLAYLEKQYAFAYKDWLVIYYLHQQLGKYQNLATIYKDIEKVLWRLASYSPLKTKDVIEIQEDRMETDISIQNIGTAIEHQIGNQQADFSDLITIEGIKKQLKQTSPKMAVWTHLEEERRWKEEEIWKVIQLEKAKTEGIFDFFQLEYEGPHDTGWNERISLGVGLNIPFNTRSSLKIEELKIEQNLLQEEYAMDKALLRAQLKRKKQAILTAIQELELRSSVQKDQQHQASNLLNNLSLQEGTSPLLMLYHKVTVVKQDLEKEKLKFAIYKEYIDFLLLSKQLVQTPFQNLLARFKGKE